MFEGRRRGRSGINIWPGFVDILSTLLLMFIFVLTIFMVSQHYLSVTLSGRTSALQRLQAEIEALAEVLSLERARSAELASEVERLSAELVATLGERDQARQQLAEQAARASALAAELAAAEEELERRQRQLEMAAEELERRQAQLTAAAEREQGLQARLAAQGAALAQAEERAGAAAEQVALLNRQLAALREQLAQLAQALELAEGTVARQRLEIEELGRQLNVALAAKVQELQRYRSEFFGRLREVLGEREDIRIVGDRFVFQSELFFETASAEIGPAGRRQLQQVAATLKELAAQIPPDIDWVLQVEGHTDIRPIRTPEFPSNWELSTARANSIVHFLIQQGIPPQRLAAAGFAEFQPVAPGRSEEAFRRNRRIELRLTSR
ncbi:MAG: peptidoglycan -binding protein [Xanthomonadaceae bacterium]|nr:peptidoglycan -binding protein [Xanthomonadaceae bacterium]